MHFRFPFSVSLLFGSHTLYDTPTKMVLNRPRPRPTLELIFEGGLGLGIVRTIWVISLFNASSIDIHASGKKNATWWHRDEPQDRTLIDLSAGLRKDVNSAAGCRRVAGHLAARKP